ncbi:hypothetical protein NL676_032761 [Syzygium grande]|nr:hypothetical protein NL676_032761 [Syzygium grande]
MDRRGRSRGMVLLLALHDLSECYRLERKPPVSAGFLATNTLAYLRPGVLDSLLPSIDQIIQNKASKLDLFKVTASSLGCWVKSHLERILGFVVLDSVSHYNAWFSC